MNWTIGCKSDRTFRLKSYSEQRLKETVDNNLDCLFRILQFNARFHILFFRITSDLVPFASHPTNTFDWQDQFRPKFEEIGNFITKNNMRISMHPDQFTLINSVDRSIFKRSCKELAYHAHVLDLLELDTSAKIQIHVGGVYGDKNKSMERFASRFSEVEEMTGRRLVIENDDRLYNLKDCLKLSFETGLPVLFDIFHHQINGTGETLSTALRLSKKTWRRKSDGIPMVDYSSQRIGGSARQHTGTIDLDDFRTFLRETFPTDYDVMLEIKDKEQSAIKAVEAASHDPRFERTMKNFGQKAKNTLGSPDIHKHVR